MHKTATFMTSTSEQKLQQTLIRVLLDLNAEAVRLEDIAYPSIHQCAVFFEFGIAETDTFSYFDDKEAEKTLTTLHKNPFQVLDLLCTLRYYKMENEKKNPLRFDYYLIRFLFNKGFMTMRIFHERGPRYVFPYDIAKLMVNKINNAFGKKILRPAKSL